MHTTKIRGKDISLAMCTLHIDLCPAVDRGHYRREGVYGGGDGVELARPVVGHEYPLHAGLHRLYSVARPQDSLEEELLGPDGGTFVLLYTLRMTGNFVIDLSQLRPRNPVSYFVPQSD